MMRDTHPFILTFPYVPPDAPYHFPMSHPDAPCHFPMSTTEILGRYEQSACSCVFPSVCVFVCVFVCVLTLLYTPSVAFSPVLLRVRRDLFTYTDCILISAFLCVWEGGLRCLTLVLGTFRLSLHF